MDLTRTARVLAARWPVVVIIALLGALAGWFGADFRNDSIETVHFGEAAIVLVEGVADDDTNRAATEREAQLESIRLAALEANREQLDLDPDTQEIETSPANTVVVTDENEVLFVAQAATPDEARERALELRARYLADPSAGQRVQFQERRAALAAQLDDVRVEIVTLRAQLADTDPNASQRAELTALQDSLRGRLIGFREELLIPEINAREQQAQGGAVDDEEPEPRPESEIQADIDLISQRLSEVQAELAQLPDPLDPEFSAAQTELEVFQQRYADLEADYLGYSLRLAELNNLVAPGETFTRTQTEADVSPGLYALVGLMLGTALAAGGILSADRMRAPVWVGQDAPFLTTLATMAERKPTGAAWYDEAGESRRRSEVQALRAGVLARLHQRAGSVAIAGNRIESVAVRALSADLAVALAQSGRSVILVDANFAPSDGLAEFPEGGLTLAKMVVDLRAGVAADMSTVRQVRSNLWSLPSGSFDEDPADLFAGDVLDRALDVLTDRYDMVIVSAGDMANTVAQEVVTRSNTSLFVASSGKSLSNEIKQYAEEFNRRGANLLGLVIINRRSVPKLADAWERLTSKGGAVIAPAEESGRSDVSEPAVVVPMPTEAQEAMMGISGNGEQPVGVGGGRGATDRSNEPRLYDVLRRPTDESVGEGAMAEVLASTLSSIDPARAYGPMADFMADMAEEIILRPRSVGFDHDGMLPLHPVKDRTTVGSAIGRLLRDDLGAKEGAALERQIIEILFGSGPLRSVPVVRKSLDAWLSIAFFRVHTARSREPQILHLISPNRYFQIMVDAQRFDGNHVSILSDEVLPMFIEDVERQQRAARRFGSEEAIAQLDRAIDDARALGRSLGDLLTARVPEAQLYYPWSDDPSPSGWVPRWDEDVRASIVPLQRLGLLSIPVLTDEELEFMAPAT
jgi:Mrp family chromosome partitioning ATPase